MSLILSLLDFYSGFSHLPMGQVAKDLTAIATCLGLIKKREKMPQEENDQSVAIVWLEAKVVTAPPPFARPPPAHFTPLSGPVWPAPV